MQHNAEDNETCANGGAGRVSQAEIVRRTGLDKGTVSRYCRKHKLVGEDGLVDFDAFVAHREANRDVRADVEEADADRRVAEAEIRKLELSRLRGELVPVESVRGAVLTAFADIFAGLDEAIDKAVAESLTADAAADAVKRAIERQRHALASALDKMAEGA